jgi:hypothetical protein
VARKNPRTPFPHIPTRGAERMNVELTKEDVETIKKLGVSSLRYDLDALCTLALEALERREQSKGSVEEVSANIEKLWLDTPCLGDPYRRLAAQRESAGIIQAYADRCVKESREGVVWETVTQEEGRDAFINWITSIGCNDEAPEWDAEEEEFKEQEVQFMFCAFMSGCKYANPEPIPTTQNNVPSPISVEEARDVAEKTFKLWGGAGTQKEIIEKATKLIVAFATSQTALKESRGE